MNPATDDRRIVLAGDVECSGRKDNGGCTVQVRKSHQPCASIDYKCQVNDRRGRLSNTLVLCAVSWMVVRVAFRSSSDVVTHAE